MKRDAIPVHNLPYAITASMIRERANVHSSDKHNLLFHFNKRSLLEFANELIGCAQGAPWPLAELPPMHCPRPSALILARARKHRPGTPLPDATGDTLRLNMLEQVSGFVRGTDCGRPAFRILGHDTWHPSLREAIDHMGNFAPEETESA